MAGKQERQRKLARERYERRLAREAQRQESLRRTTRWTAGGVVVLVVVAVVVVGVIALTHSSNSNAKALSSPSSTPSVNTTPTPTPTPTPTEVKEPATHCTYTPAGQAARNVGGTPPATPDYKATYQATINTNRGAIVIDLLNSKATCTVNSFVFLAQKGFFNKTPCPRLVTTGIFVLQCGDPTGTGTGGPGYQFESENLAGATYGTGTLAMANSGTSDSNGSQFFIVYKNTPLPPSYTPFGTVTSGLNILTTVAKAGVKPPLNPAGGGHPKESVTIESITIKKT
ncbi:MAG TPA: peptidylprolyl isomerase [Streptosporangiaceae bacterium]|nr:peptidylprolyl isomerase [Streptosporangiaceae bacterium]